MLIRCPGCGKEKNIPAGRYRCKSCKIKFELKDGAITVYQLAEHKSFIDSMIAKAEERFNFCRKIGWIAIPLFSSGLLLIPFIAAFKQELEVIAIIVLGILFFSGLVTYIAFCIVCYFTWKCPNCEESLIVGQNILHYPSHCSSCGIKIKRDD